MSLKNKKECDEKELVFSLIAITIKPDCPLRFKPELQNEEVWGLMSNETILTIETLSSSFSKLSMYYHVRRNPLKPW